MSSKLCHIYFGLIQVFQIFSEIYNEIIGEFEVSTTDIYFGKCEEYGEKLELLAINKDYTSRLEVDRETIKILLIAKEAEHMQIIENLSDEIHPLSPSLLERVPLKDITDILM